MAAALEVRRKGSLNSGRKLIQETEVLIKNCKDMKVRGRMNKVVLGGLSKLANNRKVSDICKFSIKETQRSLGNSRPPKGCE